MHPQTGLPECYMYATIQAILAQRRCREMLREATLPFANPSVSTLQWLAQGRSLCGEQLSVEEATALRENLGRAVAI